MKSETGLAGPRAQARKAALKKALAMNLSQLLKRRNMKVAELAVLLKDKGADINSFAVRAWLRQSEKRPTLPSCQNLVFLCEVFGVRVEELLGLSAVEDASFYQKLREPENRFERELLHLLSSMKKDYDACAKDPAFVQQPFRTIAESGSASNETGGTERSAYYFLLSNDLVRINPGGVERDADLEAALSRAWERDGNGSSIDHACVYKLPNKTSGEKESCNGIAEVVFLRCAAHYLIENVIRSGSTIGIAGGQTIAGIMKLLPRSEKLQGCNFFPLLRHSGAVHTEASADSTAVISDMLFRFSDLAVRMPDDIENKEMIETWANVADVLVLSLGGSERSSVVHLLQRIRQTIAPEDLEKLKTALAGDILFHIFTRSGLSLEEMTGNGIATPSDELSLAGELLGTPGEAYPEKNAHVRFVAIRKEYAEHIAGVRPDLDILKRHAKKPNRRTILVVAGTDKLEILHIFRKRVCEPDMRFTLITEQSVAGELVRSLG